MSAVADSRVRPRPQIPAGFVDGRWFSIARDGLPTKTGVFYIENTNGCYHYCYWDGREWSSGLNTPERAWLRRDIKTDFRRIAWFGLSKHPVAH